MQATSSPAQGMSTVEAEPSDLIAVEIDADLYEMIAACLDGKISVSEALTALALADPGIGPV